MPYFKKIRKILSQKNILPKGFQARGFKRKKYGQNVRFFQRSAISRTLNFTKSYHNQCECRQFSAILQNHCMTYKHLTQCPRCYSPESAESCLSDHSSKSCIILYVYCELAINVTFLKSNSSHVCVCFLIYFSFVLEINLYRLFKKCQAKIMQSYFDECACARIHESAKLIILTQNLSRRKGRGEKRER